MKFLIHFSLFILPYQYYLCVNASDCTNSSMSEPVHIPLTMKSWQMLDYGNTTYLNPDTPVPKITDPHQMLIKVIASSVNILDMYMTGGYGSVFFNFTKKIFKYTRGMQTDEFPVILGRDFVGRVVSVGAKVNPELGVGTIVMGLTLPPNDGAHAEYVLAFDSNVVKKPEEIDPDEGAAVLFAGVTAWSALNIAGDFWFRKRENKKVLVIGASGGVGTVAVQLLRSWGAQVYATTCGLDGLTAVQLLGPQRVIDVQNSTTFLDEIKEWGPFDVILDAAGLPESQYKDYAKNLKPFSFAKFISLKPPFLPNIDRYGLIWGSFKSLFDIVKTNFKCGSVLQTTLISYGIMIPSRRALQELTTLLAERKLRAVIDSIYHFDKADAAYERVRKGHLRGKVIIVY